MLLTSTHLYAAAIATDYIASNLSIIFKINTINTHRHKLLHTHPPRLYMTRATLVLVGTYYWSLGVLDRFIASLTLKLTVHSS